MRMDAERPTAHQGAIAPTVEPAGEGLRGMSGLISSLRVVCEARCRVKRQLATPKIIQGFLLRNLLYRKAGV